MKGSHGNHGIRFWIWAVLLPDSAAGKAFLSFRQLSGKPLKKTKGCAVVPLAIVVFVFFSSLLVVTAATWTREMPLWTRQRREV
jgi:hypothetical protein